jgi:hypothetical protein
MVSWPVILGLIRSNDMLPQRVTSPGYHAVFATPPAEQEGVMLTLLRLKSVFTTVPNFLETYARSTRFSSLWTVACRRPQKYAENCGINRKAFYMVGNGRSMSLIWREDEVELIHNRR